MYTTDTSSGLMHFIASCADTHSQGSLPSQFLREAGGHARRPGSGTRGRPVFSATLNLPNNHRSLRAAAFLVSPGNSKSVRSKIRTILCSGRKTRDALCWGIRSPSHARTVPTVLGAGRERRRHCDYSLGRGSWDSPAPKPSACFRITDLGTRASSSLPFPVARDQSSPDFFILVLFLGFQGTQ